MLTVSDQPVKAGRLLPAIAALGGFAPPPLLEPARMTPRRSAIALRHVAFEDLGLLAPVMAREGWDVSFREAAVDDLLDASIRDAALLIVLGGPIGVYDNDAYPFLN